jgi:hypothetical protein
VLTIDEIILTNDLRGVSALRPHVPADSCDRAAQLLLANPGTVLIATGFYILSGGAAETDGPPGAVAIGDALGTLGYDVQYVTDLYGVPILTAMGVPSDALIEFPITDDSESQTFSDTVTGELKPSVLIAIERCGLSEDGIYRNMRGRDITGFTARTDHMFRHHQATIGIGDGGNEIGMGGLAKVIPTVPSLVQMPAMTKTTGIILSSVSNWGGYGLVAALSMRVGKNLLPTPQAERDLIGQAVDAGAVDGVLGKSTYGVDGLTMEQNSLGLERLHALLADQGL